MGTRCIIEIRDGQKSVKIYRHNDGYPEGVIADLWVLLRNSLRVKNELRFHENPFEDAEYLLANFIFYAKLSSYLRHKDDKDLPYWPWEVGYGVLPQGDLNDYFIEYHYVIDAKTGKIQIYDYHRNLIFEGTLEEAYEKFAKNEFPEGCHIDKSLFS